jgi:hypothetical protein
MNKQMKYSKELYINAKALRSRKSQIKMMETISVLIIFLILLTFVVIFYVGIGSSDAANNNEDISSLRAIEITQVVSSLPEFQCSLKNIIDENCFDILKLEAFLDYTSTSTGQRILNTTYYSLFQFSDVTVYIVYPERSQMVWNIYHREPFAADPTNTRFDEKKAFIPISLYDAYSNQYYYGMLNVTVYI